MSDANDAGSAGERPLVGARFRHQGKPREKPRPDGQAAGFTVVLRGYDRHEVDDRFQELDAELDRLRSELRAAQSELRAAQERVAEYRGEVERLRHGALQTRPDERGVEEPVTNRGPLADKIIRSAQREALLIRANAQREAARIIEAAGAAQAAATAEATVEMVVPQPRSGIGSTG
jgi:cell division septum initiation protein DivIVA